MPDVSDMPLHNQEGHQETASPQVIGRRTAWVIVIIMSVLLVLALLGTIWGFVRQARILTASRAGATAQASAPQAAATLILAPGARIVSATTDAGKLVLHVSTPSGGEVEIIDLASGKQTGRIATTAP